MNKTRSTPVVGCHSAMLTDLYELTMAAAYWACNFTAVATFELFVRGLPPGRSYLVACGLEQALEYLEALQFQPHEIEYLRRHPTFAHVPAGFFDYLRDFRFTGEVWAMPEGTPVFANEPLLRVTAPIIEAQIVETYLLATIAFQTLVATKAARLVEAAQGRAVVEFGTRRAHGPEAGTLAARAAFIGGCIGTSNVEAGMRFGIPTFGTIAHSFIMAYGDEDIAFRRFGELYPENNILLVDTFDTMRAIEKIIALGLRPSGVRIDSGNLAELSRSVRARLDEAGLHETKIFASGDLDEFSITRLLAQQSPIDYFAVGTALSTSKDAPALGAVYKVVELSEQTSGDSCATAESGPLAPPVNSSIPRLRFTAKFAEDKTTLPGRKQVFRLLHDGCAARDIIARADEQYEDAIPLLKLVMRDGRRLKPAGTLQDLRRYATEALARVPLQFRELQNAVPYPVEVSAPLRDLLEQTRREQFPERRSRARE